MKFDKKDKEFENVKKEAISLFVDFMLFQTFYFLLLHMILGKIFG